MNPYAIISLVFIVALAIVYILFIAKVPPFNVSAFWIDPMTGEKITDSEDAYKPAPDNPWKEYNTDAYAPNVKEIIDKML